jgi:hypothetical protein
MYRRRISVEEDDDDPYPISHRQEREDEEEEEEIFQVAVVNETDRRMKEIRGHYGEIFKKQS